MRLIGWRLFLGCAFSALVGCSGSQGAPPQAMTAPAIGNPADAMPKDNSDVKGVVKHGLYVNADGKALCPVTGNVVTDGKGVGHTTYKGVEYVFCCAGCPEEFKAHPDKYAMK